MYYLEVRDETSGRVLGRIADLSTSGLLLLAPEPIPSGREVRVRVVDSAGVRPLTPVLCARAVWTRPDANPDLHLTGFALPRPAPEAIPAITAIIWELGFSGRLLGALR